MHFKTTNKRWVSSNQFTTLPFGEIKSFFVVFVVRQPIIQQMSGSCGYRSLLHVRATHTIDQNSQSFQITKFTISLCAKRCFYGSFYFTKTHCNENCATLLMIIFNMFGLFDSRTVGKKCWYLTNWALCWDMRQNTRIHCIIIE